MYQLLITVYKGSHVGPGVSVNQTVASFTSAKAANKAYSRLTSAGNYGRSNAFSERLVEKLYDSED